MTVASGALTAEQEALVDSVRALLDRRADSAAVRRGFDADLWAVLCEQIGVAGLDVPEAYGGAGAGLLESALVLEELGRALVPTPLLGAVVAAEGLRGASGAGELLGRIAAGEPTAVVSGEGPVLLGDLATLLVTVDGPEIGVLEHASVEPVPGMDPTLTFATVSGGTPRTLGGDADAARRALLVGLAALASGCARRGLEMTVAYAKERRQFGRPIGSFQALKHRMADLFVLVEMSRSAAWGAAAGTLDPAAAAAYATEAACTVAGETIQLHGGIGITWEHDAHLVLKRAHALRQLAGRPHRLRADVLQRHLAGL